MPLTHLDIQTVFTLLFLGNLTTAIILAAYQTSPEKKRPYHQFMAGKICQTTAWLLFMFRGDLPPMISILGGNSLLFIGFACETLAMINSDRVRRPAEQVYTIIAAGSVVACILLVSTPDNIRVALASLIGIILFLPCAGFLIYYAGESLLRRVIGALFSLFCITSFVRLNASLFPPSTGYTLYSANYSQSVEFLLLFFIMLVSGIGFLLLLKEYDDKTLYGSLDEKNRLVEDLSESEAFSRSLADNMPDYIIVYSLDADLLYVNPAFINGLGYSSEKVLNNPLSSFVAEEFRKIAENAISARISGQNPEPYEIDLLTRDNKRRSVIVKGSTVKYKNTRAILVVFTDITERKEVERKLQENHDKCLKLFQENRDAIVIVNDDGVILEVNREFERFFLFQENEVRNTLIDTLNIGLNRQILRSILEHGTREKTVIHQEIQVQNRNGVPCTTIVTLSEIEIDSKPCMIIQIHDIEANHRVQEAVRQVNSKLQIMYGVTRHDILNWIMVTAFHCNELKPSLSDDNQKIHLNTIQKATDEIKRLIEFTRQYKDLGTMPPDWQRISDLVKHRDIHDLLTRVEWRFELSNLEIFADMLLDRVLYNLIKNSLQHGKNVTVIKMTSLEESGEMIIWFEDNGGGIAPDSKEKIFEKGFDTESGEKNGYGLFFIREILSVTGISITENGGYGVGARFEIRVPGGKYRNYKFNT